MRRVKVKICGITNLDDALAAQEFSADALGFVFYPKSPRYIKAHTAQKIISHLGKKIKKVGVFVNPSASYARTIAKRCGLDMLQFHGDETAEFCQEFSDYKIIKAFRIKDKGSFSRIYSYNTDYYLFDAFIKDSLGGTGKKFNWALIKNLKIRKPFFLSGGLTPQNISSAIKAVQPDWVDASSGVEASAGIKDKMLIREFIAEAKTL